MAFVNVGGTDEYSWACGRAPNSRHARTKARAEAIEWLAAETPSSSQMLSASYNDLASRALDPLTIARYLPEQLGSRTRLVRFSGRAKQDWVECVETTTGTRKYVLSDFVYSASSTGNKRRYFYANSSGCAAHRTEEQAAANAVLELIERDAFMVTWLNRCTPPQVQTNTLPAAIQRRIGNLREHGFDLVVADIALEFAPTLLIVLRHRSFPFLSCSAASTFELENTLDKALMEAEASAFCRLRDGPGRMSVRPEFVVTPEEHGVLYEQRRAIARACFLFGEGGPSVSFRKLAKKKFPADFNLLLRALRAGGLVPHLVTLHKDSSGLEGGHVVVVRAIVPGMVPMTFGYDLTPLALPRIKSASLAKYGRAAHTGKLERFPHPFN